MLMHLFTSHRDSARRYFAQFDLPTHPVCWLRGHRAKAEVIDSKFESIDSWILVACRTCGIRHSDPYMSRDLGLNRESTEEAKTSLLLRQIEACRVNNARYARVRDGRDGYGHHRLELNLEVPQRGRSYRRTGLHLRLGDRWSETPLDGSVHLFGWSAYFSVGGVGNRLAHWLTKGKKKDIRIGAKYKGD